MPVIMKRLLVFTLIATIPLTVSTLVAQQTNPVHAHIGHVMDGFRSTPDGLGLLPTAIAEAKIAAQHATLVAGSADNLDAMKRHAGHVLHAVDPSGMSNGPGLGFGVKAAAVGAARHIRMAADSEGASENVTTHTQHVETSANNTVERADELIALAKAIQEATTVANAATAAERLSTLAAQLMTGQDANGDGRIGWQENEGGLQQAEQHANIMKKGEGLP